MTGLHSYTKHSNRDSTGEHSSGKNSRKELSTLSTCNQRDFHLALSYLAASFFNDCPNGMSADFTHWETGLIQHHVRILRITFDPSLCKIGLAYRIRVWERSAA